MAVSIDVEPVVMTGLVLNIDGMTCAVCSGTVERCLRNIPGVLRASVNLSTQTAKVYCEPDLRIETVCEAVEAVGFGAVPGSPQGPRIPESVVVTLGDRKAVDALLSLDGVNSVSVNNDQDISRVAVQYDRHTTKARWILKQIRESGYAVDIVEEFSDLHLRKVSMESRQDEESARWLSRFKLSLFLTLPVLMICMSPSRSMSQLFHGCSLRTFLLAIFVTPVQFYIGAGFYRGAVRSLRAGAANMDVLVALGTSAAYLYSIVSLVSMVCNSDDLKQEIPTFFETSAYLITFILLGKYLEMIAKAKTSNALLQLMGLTPKIATVVRVDHKNSIVSSEIVDTSMIEVGELVCVLRGEKFPADGVVVSGTSTVNESLVTGESIPVMKVAGDSVIGASVNLDDQLIVLTTATGSDTVLSSIISLVEEAQMNKAPIQAQADKLASIFVPAVIMTSLSTFAFWFALLKIGVIPQSIKTPLGIDDFLFSFMFAVSVTVISCPCALGLATPTAVMVATGVAARLGILIKGGQPLERAGKASVVLFDKTGTLTVGSPRVVGAHFIPDTNVDDFWKLVGSAEMQSEHLIGKALYSHALEQAGFESRFPEPQTFEAQTGAGIVAQVANFHVVIGNRSWLADHGVYGDQWESMYCEEASALGHTSVLAAINHRLVAVIHLADACKPEASSVIEHLKNQGCDVWMVTGDNRQTAKSIADRIGIAANRIASEIRPAGKRDLVASLQRQGHVVVFVGDGINDSPAIAQSDVGIALGTGADVAVASADIVLLRNKLTEVVTALDLSKVALTRIKQNLLWALVYNIIAIPAAAGVFYPFFHLSLPPAIAGAAMAFSSVSVVVSSLFLERYNPPAMCRKSPTRRPKEHAESHETEQLLFSRVTGNFVYTPTSNPRSTAL